MAFLKIFTSWKVGEIVRNSLRMSGKYHIKLKYFIIVTFIEK